MRSMESSELPGTCAAAAAATDGVCAAGSSGVCAADGVRANDQVGAVVSDVLEAGASVLHDAAGMSQQDMEVDWKTLGVQVPPSRIPASDPAACSF